MRLRPNTKMSKFSPNCEGRLRVKVEGGVGKLSGGNRERRKEMDRSNASDVQRQRAALHSNHTLT